VETIRLGDIAIALTRKEIKHVHLSVHPPRGRVSLVAPTGTRLEVVRAYAISKLGWIRDQRAKLLGQARETPRRFISRESHYLWGRRYLMAVVEETASLPCSSITVGSRAISATPRNTSSASSRGST